MATANDDQPDEHTRGNNNVPFRNTCVRCMIIGAAKGDQQRGPGVHVGRVARSTAQTRKPAVGSRDLTVQVSLCSIFMSGGGSVDWMIRRCGNCSCHENHLQQLLVASPPNVNKHTCRVTAQQITLANKNKHTCRFHSNTCSRCPIQFLCNFKVPKTNKNTMAIL